MKFLHQISQFDINEHLSTKKLKSMHIFLSVKSIKTHQNGKIFFFNMEWGYD